MIQILKQEANAMKAEKKKKLESRGWRVGSATDFLGLSKEEAAYIELKLALSENLRKLRKTHKLTQVRLAGLLHSSQSRIAKMEIGDPTVSLDLLIRSLLALGITRKGLSRMILFAQRRAA